MLIQMIEDCKTRLGSYEKLADRLDVMPSAISDFKAGRRKPNVRHIAQMADILKIDQWQAVCVVMEELDTEHNYIWKKWRPYGDSNPGYRRERATALSLFFIVKFCNLALMQAKHLSNRVNFQVLNVHIVALCVYLNAPIIAKRDISERLALSES